MQVAGLLTFSVQLGLSLDTPLQISEGAEQEASFDSRMHMVA